MKTTKFKSLLATSAIALSLAICVFTPIKPLNLRILENVEALSSGETYLDFAWIVKVYYCDGELLVACEEGGQHQCPMDDPRTHV